jgi:type III restriction enzyme
VAGSDDYPVGPDDQRQRQGDSVTESIDNPIINSPYEPPAQHFEVGPRGPTGEIKAGRRASESFVPIAAARKGKRLADGGTQDALDFDITGERRERNSLINELRREVDRWRQRDYERVTPTSRKLLQHWADPGRENRVLYCQRESAETAIFLAEVAGRHGYTDWRQRVDEANAEHNSALPRVALKMATGSGKTVVMAMLIAWQTLNKVTSPRDARFAKRFLVVTPGITIRDRLRVLQPGDPGNYYDERDLIPPDLRPQLNQAQVIITNYHSFLLRDAKEIKGVAKTTRAMLLAGKAVDPFRETPEAMVSRVLRDFGVSSDKGRQEVVVFNDEAHHCYQDKPIAVAAGAKLTKEQQEANADARVWFRGIQAVAKRVGVKAVYDLSATPYYLSGSGYHEGFLFPWTVSDFSLMDAIESGIVKIPRTPVDDDAEGDLVTYLRLWDHIGDRLPKRKTTASSGPDGWIMPPELEGALQSLYRSYQRSFEHWQQNLADLGETPPVFIVVCPNTVVSKLVYDWIAGTERTDEDQTIRKPGRLELFSNIADGKILPRPRTILVDSAQLESGEALKPDFKAAAATEIEAFKSEYRRRSPGADVDKLTEEDLLREVMNTVGKKGKLGEHVRCVVSVAMLTEGWDANTVTHILGIRAFRSQLLCEQVVGRGLRRRSYVVNDEGLFEPEYANVYGIPFAFIPSDRPLPEAVPRPPAIEVAAVEGREHLRITFPKLDGYRIEVPDEQLLFDAATAPVFRIGPSTVPTRVEVAGIVGEAEQTLDADPRRHRTQEVAFALARRLLDNHFSGSGQERRPWLFPALVTICRNWLHNCVRVAEGYDIDQLLRYAERQAEAVEAIQHAITVQVGNRRGRLRPMLRRFDPTGSTADVRFLTRKAVTETEKSEVSHVTLDGKDGNTWEQILSLECELHPDVAAYVKNDHLGLAIPYVHKGVTHSYVPDFLLRLRRADGEDFDRTLIVEVSGGQKSPGPTKVKAQTARDSWCAAVNNHGGFGRWGYVEITTMVGVKQVLADAMRALYDDAPIVGDPELLDFNLTNRGVRSGA